jgi:uncharacterized protein (DUF983 family)
MTTQARHHIRPAQARVRPARAALRGRMPEDAALYRCGCGKAFTAAVSTCVTCPGCGEPQAW